MAPVKPRPQPPANAAIRRYYERNTPLFLSRGLQGKTGTTHRAVWAEGIKHLAQALTYTNGLIYRELLALQQASPTGVLRVIDLGCGVGGSLLYLADRFPGGFWGLGVTISALQANLALQSAHEAGLHLSCAFLVADYLHLPLAGEFDAAFSIEAFAHASDPQRYLEEASRLLRSGGRLALCDDFSYENAAPDNFWLSAFKRGWLAPRLCSPAQVEEMATICGLRLISKRDLTSNLRLSRLSGWLARPMVAAGLHLGHPYLNSLLGGMALQQALKNGIVTYQLMVFEKRSSL